MGYLRRAFCGAAAEQPGVPGALPAAFGRPGEGLERPGRAVVSDFLNKVLKLAALRISDICERLDFEPLDRDQIVSQVLLTTLPDICHTGPTQYRKDMD